MTRYDCVVIGGGIVGLATAHRLLERWPRAKLLLVEKERDVAQHQSGRNSGVIHAGLYYKPGSLKAQLARAGNASMVEFCQAHGIRHARCGKLIVATSEAQLPALEALRRRAEENGIAVEPLGPEQAREREPHVSCVAALHVPSTGVVSYRDVAHKLAELIRARGGELWLGVEARRLVEQGGAQVLETAAGDVEARFAIACAGLQSDRFARRSGLDPGARIVPFRGEYYELVPARRELVKGLIYPVPDPAFPFLGVHFTRMIDGSVHAGPNAVLALRREGYRKREVSMRDALEIARFNGFWRLARRHARAGAHELWRSLSKRAFVRSLQELVPDVRAQDLVRSDAGVRAQALRPDGTLVDDFLIVRGNRSLHVCNAPSPAATASLEIARALVAQTPDLA